MALRLMMQSTLFDDMTSIFLTMPNADVCYYPDFISMHQQYYSVLLEQINWQQSSIKLFGNQMPIPRLNAWYADTDKDYSYSGIKLQRNDWCPAIKTIKEQLENRLSLNFNSVLANYYRDGQDSVGWHSDDEPELGLNPIIASISFGDARRFSFRSIHNASKPVHLNLESGSLLLMQGETQHYWQHQLAKTNNSQLTGRINLTFRQIVSAQYNG